MHKVVRVCSVLFIALSAAAQQPSALLRADAQKAIETHTRINICANAEPTSFVSVLTAPAIEYKPRSGAQETKWLYPVKANYTILCTQGNRNMRYGEVTAWKIEVQGDFRLYKDPYGELQVANNFDDDWSWDDQDWNNAKADVRCRAKRLGYDTYDPATLKFIKRREDASQGFGACTVRLAVDKK